jgi:F-box interacting protein
MSTAYQYHPLAPSNNGQGQLRPPTKLLGCLRTVGWPSSKTNPLLVAAVYTATDAKISRVDVKLVDVASGATVARLDRQGNGHFGVTGGLLCLVGTGGTAAVSVLDPATGDVTNIPAYTAPNGQNTSSAYVFGHVPATGEHKVLRVYTAGHGETKQPCEILTLGSSKQRWRPAQSPPVRVDTLVSRHRAVTGGVAHFLIPQRAEYDVIASFDMATEEWRPALLQAPLSSDKCNCCSNSLSLVELNGCLVFVHHDYVSFSMDMWVLTTDLNRRTWLRVEPLPLGKILRGDGEIMAQPLMVLDDGRIAFWVRAPNRNSVVRLYDPRTGGCEEVVSFGKLCSAVGLYRGSLLGVK